MGTLRLATQCLFLNKNFNELNKIQVNFIGL